MLIIHSITLSSDRYVTNPALARFSDEPCEKMRHFCNADQIDRWLAEHPNSLRVIKLAPSAHKRWIRLFAIAIRPLHYPLAAHALLPCLPPWIGRRRAHLQAVSNKGRVILDKQPPIHFYPRRRGIFLEMFSDGSTIFGCCAHVSLYEGLVFMQSTDRIHYAARDLTRPEPPSRMSKGERA